MGRGESGHLSRHGDLSLWTRLLHRRPEKEEHARRPLLPVMEGISMVSEDNTRDVSSSKKPLQRRRWERLGLVQPPEDDRDTGSTLLQCGQEALHLGWGRGVNSGETGERQAGGLLDLKCILLQVAGLGSCLKPL